MSSAISLDFEYTTTVEKLWSALTDSGKLAKWVWNNDFKPVVGHRFQFRAEPVHGWDGIVEGEVLEVEEPHRLSYTWVSAGQNHTVTWTLTEVRDGTVRLHLDQTGIIGGQQAVEGAKYGWTNMAGGSLKKLLEQ